jgi:hypothetical protein
MTNPTPIAQWKVTLQAGGIQLNQDILAGDYTAADALAFANVIVAEAKKGAAAHAVGTWLLSHGVAQAKVLACINDLVSRAAGSPALLAALAPVTDPQEG